MEEVRVPWNAWYEDTEIALFFPKEWDVRAVPMRDAPDIGDEAIAEAFRCPIGTPTLGELAHGRRDAIIAVDDITRPTPGSRILPLIIRELCEAGIPEDKIRIIIALGLHRPHLRAENLAKLGREVTDRFEVLQHYAHSKNHVYLGSSSRGTPIALNRFFMEADVKIGVGCIIPHSSAGYAGGGKIVLPGLASFETIETNHAPAEAGETGGIGIIEGNQFRQEVEEYEGYRQAAEGRQMVVFSPNVSRLDVRQCITEDCLVYGNWELMIKDLLQVHGPGTRVAVFPVATMQVAEELRLSNREE